MKGAGKVHGSLVRETKPKNQRVKNKTKKKSRQVRNRLLPKYGLSQKNRLNTLKKKLEEEDSSDRGVGKNFLRAIRFINVFTEKYDVVMESNNGDKRSNYSLFATMLAANILSVVKEYNRIIDDEELYLNNNADELLASPNEFLEEFVEYIEEDKIADTFGSYAIKYFKKSRPNRMEINNKSFEELEENYKEYRGLLEDTVSAVKNTIKEYSLDEKIQEKIAVNNDLNDLVEGMLFMKINRENKSVNDLSSMFKTLGL
jgi:hypothetical protein